MKRTVRFGMFETNSSSVHTLTLINDEDYKRWESGELAFNKYGELIPYKELDKYQLRYAGEYNYFSPEELHSNAEVREREIIDENKNKVHIVSAYIYD